MISIITFLLHFVRSAMNCQKIFIIIWFINKVRRLLCKDNVFSLRKYKFGLTSVLLGTALVLVLDRLRRMSRRQLVRQGKVSRLSLWYQRLSLLSTIYT